MSDKRLYKIFSKSMYKLAKETDIPLPTLCRYNNHIPKAIKMKLISKLAKHAKIPVAEFMKQYLS